MVKDSGALVRATSDGPRATTGFRQQRAKSPRMRAGGIWVITRRGGNNDRLSTLWREVISLAGVARSCSSDRLKRTGAIMKIQVRSLDGARNCCSYRGDR